MSEQDMIARLRGLPPELCAPVDRFERVSRRVRRRRARVAAATGVAGLCLALAVPFGVNNVDTDPDTAVDPVDPVAPTVSYPPEELPSVMQDEAQRLLSPSLGTLPPATVAALDGVDTLRPHEYARAQTVTLTFDVSPTHQVDFRITQSRSEAEGDLDEYCDYDIFLSCEVTQVDGAPVIVSTSVIASAGRGRLAYVTPGQPSTVPGVDEDSTYYVERTAKAIRTDTMVSSVSERTVYDRREDPNQAAATAFTVPVSALSNLAANPAVVIE